ncbi:MAG: hypothetical protein K2K10_04550, partial [Acetatifactor sp.]|nr:hypothetical protein [Acetatifactor sp.]
LAGKLADAVRGEGAAVLGPAAASIGTINAIYRFVFYIKHEDYGQLVRVKDQLEELLLRWQLGNGQVQFDFDPMHCL